MKKIAVLGAGIMGAGIAQVAAQAGFEVILRDLQLSLVKDGMKIIVTHVIIKEEIKKQDIDFKTISNVRKIIIRI